MKSSNRITCLLIVAFLVGSASVLQAQEGKGEEVGDVAKSSYADSFSIKFEGGSAEKLIEAIEARGINIITTGPIGDIEIPPFEIRNSNPQMLFNALNLLMSRDPHSRISQAMFRSSGNTNQPNASDIWTFAASPVNRAEESKTRTRPTPVQRRIGESMFIGSLLKSFSIDEITSAVSEGINLESKMNASLYGNNTAALHYHPETQVLIIVGPTESIIFARNIIESLEESAEFKKKESKPSFE